MMGGTNKWMELGLSTEPAVGGNYCPDADLPEDLYKEVIGSLNKNGDTISAEDAKAYIDAVPR